VWRGKSRSVQSPDNRERTIRSTRRLMQAIGLMRGLCTQAAHVASGHRCAMANSRMLSVSSVLWS
jgi:hypothetical protein